MKIVADDNIPGIREWCGSLGEIELVEGRHLRRAQLHAAEVLLVRSVTRVNEALLAGTPVQFVGTATAGVDHIDLDYLRARGIHFAAAPGCNALAVAEYVLACCVAYADERQQPLAELTVGVIGYGEAGSAVVRLLSVLGVHCLVSDPPRALRDPDLQDLPLSAVLRADIVTLHVPLTMSGPYPTHQLIGEAEIAAMSPRAMLINAARGGVFREQAWIADAQRRLVLDCWIGEPRIDPVLRDTCWIASPHIAGHTVDARWRATEMLAGQLAAFLGAAAPVNPAPLPSVTVSWPDEKHAEPWQNLVFTCCDPRHCTAALRAGTGAPDAGVYFDQLRKRFGVRREFGAHTIAGVPDQRVLRDRLEALGFRLAA